MSRPPLTHYSTRRSSFPVPAHHRTSQVQGIHNLAPAPERKQFQWPPSNRKFWIYESPSSSSSQDGKSSSSSGSGGSKPSGSGGSETQEERRVRTVSPYGSFFAEEMESDTPAEKNNENNRSFRQGDGSTRQEHENGVFLHPMKRVPTKNPNSNWTSSQAQSQLAPVFFTTGYPPTAFSNAVPVPAAAAVRDLYHDATTTMTEIPLSALSLAENSRRSQQPPVSWRQRYPDHPNHLPQWGSYSQHDPHQVATAVPRDERQMDARNDSRRQR